MTVSRTVADEYRRRLERPGTLDCRYGIVGVRMRHLPTGREFTCAGAGNSWDDDMWDDDDAADLLVYVSRRESDGGEFRLIYSTEFMATDIPKLETFRADECVLLSPWPVVC